MTTYYVATNGNDSASGSTTSPWKTINYAMQSSAVKAGDVVIVRSGTYDPLSITKSGSAAAGYITLKSEAPGGAKIVAGAQAGYGINVGGNYLTIDGFDIKGPSREAHGIQANGVHHINILNNVVHDSGASGIQFNWADFIRIEGNETYNNASLQWYSGISIYENRNITGDTTTTGYRTIVRNNISHDNVQSTGLRTDGNGIIIDDFQNSQTNGAYPNYGYKTLVEGNVVYNNGGKGIAVHWSDNVTIDNNTAYHNNLDNGNTGTWRGELSQQDSANNVWVNNIAVADPSVNSNNTAIGFYGGNSNTKWLNNITFNGSAGQSSLKLEGGNNPAPTATNGNKLGVDPMFVNPASGDFHVKAGSPAIDAGNGSYVVGTTDVDGAPRVVGTVDIGAYEQATTGSVNHPPVANPDSGFITTANTPITISMASLLANDTDADGNTLSLTDVSSASHGSAQIQGSNVIFTPDSGYTGAAGFNYSISDGKGGTASSSVGLTVNPASTNAAPTFTSGNAFSINENTKSVGTVTAKDAEGDALTFSKVGGADAALFTIDSKTGAISFVNAPDFEKPADADGNNVYLLDVGVTDGKHTAVTSSLQISVKDVNETTSPSPTGSSFFASNAVPATTETKDTADYELGMKFRTLKDGDITALRYYRGSADAGDTDTRTLHLWNSKGQQLAEATVTSAPGATGWQTAVLSTPIKATAQSLYVVSYGTTQNYAETQKYFGSAMTNADGTLSAPAGADGVYNIKAGTGTGPGFFPTQTWNASNYWADVIFKSSTTSTAAAAPAPAALSLTGTDAADVLVGDANKNTILGHGGNDRILGHGGADDLTGGAGSDVFVYTSASDSPPLSPDTIRDFTRGVDKIDLSPIDAIKGGADSAFVWIGSNAFSGAEGQLRIQSTPTGLVLQGDINGDGTADISIALHGNFHTLHNMDVLL